MAGNNRRIRRASVDILFESGPLTKNQIIEYLDIHPSVASVPSPNSLGALLAKNPQVIKVGLAIEESMTGKMEKKTKFDVNRNLIKSRNDILHTFPLNALMKRV